MEKEKLKTIKDFREQSDCPQCGVQLKCPTCNMLLRDEHYWVNYAELRAEAVKRAEYFRKMRDINRKEENFMASSYWKGRLDEALEANNLSEEDLQDG